MSCLIRERIYSLGVSNRFSLPTMRLTCSARGFDNRAFILSDMAYLVKIVRKYTICRNKCQYCHHSIGEIEVLLHNAGLILSFKMENDPELDGKYLGTISKDFVIVSDTLKEASYQVIKREFSKYPVFPISKTEVPIGKLLIDKSEFSTDWNYHITYIDEFVHLGIVEEDKVKEFEKVYKDPDEFCCLFVIDGEFTKFIFIPYPED